MISEEIFLSAMDDRDLTRSINKCIRRKCTGPTVFISIVLY